MRITSGGAVQATNNLTANSPSAGNTGEGIIAGTSFKIDAGGTGQKAKMFVVSKDLSDTYGNGLQIQFANQADDKGFAFNLTTGGAYETYIKSGGSWNRAMTITSGGNVVIGGTSDGFDTGSGLRIDRSGVSTIRLVGQSSAAEMSMTSSGYQIDSRIGYIRFLTGANSGTVLEGMRITDGGAVLIGRINSGLNNTEGVTISGGAIQLETNSYVIYGNRTSSNGVFMGIRRNNTDVGDISVTTTTTTYNTSSDYRLKQDFKEFNGLDIISKIKSYDFSWKLDNSRMYGVIAHELQEILPYAVTGIKDGEKMQSADYSKITPILIKAIQEQQAQIEELKAKLN